MNSITLKVLQGAAFAAALSATSVATAQKPPAPAAAPTAPAAADDRTSYLFGLTYGAQMRNAGITTQVSVDAIARGIKDGLQGTQPSAADGQQLQNYVTGVQKAATAKNEADAAAFLVKNGKEKGVVTTASGLEYKVLAPGDKKAPAIASTDQVTVQYRGKLIDGTEFDSSYARGTPATFPVNGVIKGWQEALVLMKPGAKYELFVPPALGYGDQARPKIPPGSLLIFDVEMVSSANPAAPPAAPPGTPVTPPNPTH
jgi:FKBP-type peptidyl-prolyl cis-trans isomerase